MSRNNISRSNFKYTGRVNFSPYQADKPGVEMTPFFKWKPQGWQALTFTTALLAGATTAVLTGNWGGGTSAQYEVTLSSGQSVQTTLTNGSTAVTFAAALIAAATVNAAVGPTSVNNAQPSGGVPPAAAIANGYSLSQSVGASTAALLNGSLVSGFTVGGLTAGFAQPDIPRNVVAAWTTTAIITISGLDYYGQPQTEVSASGTSWTGKKTFSKINSITPSVAVTAFTAGTGTVLGLPFRTDASDLHDPRLNNATDAGTFVPADLTNPATSSTGDVRGTYAPAGTLNSSNWLSVLITVPDDSTVLGSYGQTPA